MKELNSGVYMIINMVNQKVYVGSSKRLIKRRKEHFKSLKENKHNNFYLQYAYNKYGEESFKWEILKRCKEDKLLKWEQYYMNKYNSCNQHCGYNLSVKAGHPLMSPEGKERMRMKKIGKKLSEEHIEKIRIGNIGKKRTEEMKRKYSKCKKGVIFSSEHKAKLKLINLGRKGAICSPEKREKIRQSQLGKIIPEETKEKMRIARIGLKLSEEHKRNISLGNTGKKRSEESKKKMSLSQKGRKHTALQNEKHRQRMMGNKINLKFNDVIVNEWKKLREQGLSYKKIGIMYGASKTTVSKRIKS